MQKKYNSQCNTYTADARFWERWYIHSRFMQSHAATLGAPKCEAILQNGGKQRGVDWELSDQGKHPTLAKLRKACTGKKGALHLKEQRPTQTPKQQRREYIKQDPGELKTFHSCQQSRPLISPRFKSLTVFRLLPLPTYIYNLDPLNRPNLQTTLPLPKAPTNSTLPLALLLFYSSPHAQFIPARSEEKKAAVVEAVPGSSGTR